MANNDSRPTSPISIPYPNGACVNTVNVDFLSRPLTLPHIALTSTSIGPQSPASFRSQPPSWPTSRASSPSVAALAEFPPLPSSSLQTGNSPGSMSSSVYLTPPSGQADLDYPLHNAVMLSPADSAAIAWSTEEAMSSHEQKPERRRSGRNSCASQKEHGQQQAEPYWWSPSCLVTTTSVNGSTNRCDSCTPFKFLLHSTTKTLCFCTKADLQGHGTNLSIFRRWSSMEVQTNLVSLESIATCSSMPAEPKFKPTNTPQHLASLKECRRRSDCPQRREDHHVVGTVREKLTFRKASTRQMETPPIIKLRRATSASQIVGSFGRKMSYFNNDYGETSPTRAADATDHSDCQSYLATSIEDDTGTKLPQTSIHQLTDDDSHQIPVVLSTSITSKPTTIRYLPKEPKSPRITREGLIVRNVEPARAAITGTKVQRRFRSPRKLTRMHLLSATFPVNSKNSLASRFVRRSVHKILWEESYSFQALQPSTDIEEFETTVLIDCPAHSNLCSPSGPIFHPPPRRPRARTFDDSRTSNSPDRQASVKDSFSWSRSDYPAVEPLVAAVSHNPKGSEAQTQQQERYPDTTTVESHIGTGGFPPASNPGLDDDVVSFPPLASRRNTIDWWPPLPDIGICHTSSYLSHNLYDLGLDITCTSPRLVEFRSPAISPPPSIPISPNTSTISLYSYRLSTSKARTTSISTLGPADPLESAEIPHQSHVKCHPHATARLGEAEAIGCSIGACTGERRRHSVKPRPPRRVTTIENKPKQDAPMVKVRPPSVCPPPKTPSPSELSDKSGWLGGQDEEREEENESESAPDEENERGEGSQGEEDLLIMTKERWKRKGIDSKRQVPEASHVLGGSRPSRAV